MNDSQAVSRGGVHPKTIGRFLESAIAQALERLYQAKLISSYKRLPLREHNPDYRIDPEESQPFLVVYGKHTIEIESKNYGLSPKTKPADIERAQKRGYPAYNRHEVEEVDHRIVSKAWTVPPNNRVLVISSLSPLIFTETAIQLLQRAFEDRCVELGFQALKENDDHVVDVLVEGVLGILASIDDESRGKP